MTVKDSREEEILQEAEKTPEPVKAPFVDRSECLFEYMTMIALNNKAILKIG